MKALAILLALASTSFAGTAQFQDKVQDLINESIRLGDFSSAENLSYVGVNVRGDETYKLSYTFLIFGKGRFQHSDQDIDEVVGSQTDCEYIIYSEEKDDFFFTTVKCEEPVAKALGLDSNFSQNEAEISEVLQTNDSFGFVLDYEVPVYLETIFDDLRGNTEIYLLDYVTRENVSICEYITFEPESQFLTFTGVTCGQSIDNVIDERLKEID